MPDLKCRLLQVESNRIKEQDQQDDSNGDPFEGNVENRKLFHCSRSGEETSILNKFLEDQITELIDLPAQNTQFREHGRLKIIAYFSLFKRNSSVCLIKRNQYLFRGCV